MCEWATLVTPSSAHCSAPPLRGEQDQRMFYLLKIAYHALHNGKFYRWSRSAIHVWTWHRFPRKIRRDTCTNSVSSWYLTMFSTVLNPNTSNQDWLLWVSTYSTWPVLIHILHTVRKEEFLSNETDSLKSQTKGSKVCMVLLVLLLSELLWSPQSHDWIVNTGYPHPLIAKLCDFLKIECPHPHTNQTSSLQCSK